MKNRFGIFHHKGMATFLWVWFGQLVSILGTAMTRFALMIWAYQQTSSASSLAFLGAANYVPYLALSPLAGVVIDRWDRRKVMLLADLLAGLVTATLLALYGTGHLQIWHLYVAEALSGACEAFQLPAYYAAVSLLVPRDQISRTNGLRSLAANGSRVFAPLFAGALLAWFGIQVVMVIDLVTFAVSVVVLSLVCIPRPAASAEGQAACGNFWQEMKVGFFYIFRRPGLRGLMLVMFGMNVLASLTYFSILPAMILARSGKSEWTLGVVQSIMGTGGFVGALLLSTWGGPRKRIHSVLAGGFISFLLGDMLFALGRDVYIWSAAAFLSTLTIPFIAGGQQSIWQVKVAPDLQGRVFSAKDTLQQLVMPFGYAAGGLLADYLFEPAMRSGGLLSARLGWLVGEGPGAGMGLMFIITCLAGSLLCLSGYFSAPLRNVERDLPDMV